MNLLKMNLFTSVPAVVKVIDEIVKYNKHIPDIKHLRAIGDYEGERALIQKAGGEWAVNVSRRLKITYDIQGEENIPASGPVVIYANHQSYADAIALYYLFRNHFQIGFVAKNEFRKYGPLATSIDYTRSVFLVRGASREAVKSLHSAVDLIKNGFSLAVFPEGTRSRGPEMGEFKMGSFKFAQKANVPVLPITLNGGYNLYEGTGSYHPCKITIKVHPLVHIENMDRKEQIAAYKQIEETIRQGLK